MITSHTASLLNSAKKYNCTMSDIFKKNKDRLYRIYFCEGLHYESTFRQNVNRSWYTLTLRNYKNLRCCENKKLIKYIRVYKFCLIFFFFVCLLTLVLTVWQMCKKIKERKRKRIEDVYTDGFLS